MSNWDHEKWDKTVECFQRAYDIRSEIYGQVLSINQPFIVLTETKFSYRYVLHVLLSL
jgi:hypothetical protein